MSSMSIDSQHKRNVARVCPLVFLHIHYGTISSTCHSQTIVLSYISQFCSGGGSTELHTGQVAELAASSLSFCLMTFVIAAIVMSSPS